MNLRATAILALAVIPATLPGEAALAQGTKTQLTLQLSMASIDVRPRESVEIPGELTYSLLCVIPPARATTVRLEVAAEPSWSDVSVAPSSFTLELGPPVCPSNEQRRITRSFQAQIVVGEAGEDALTGNASLVATADPNEPYEGSQARASLLLHVRPMAVGYGGGSAELGAGPKDVSLPLAVALALLVGGFLALRRLRT